MVLPVEKLIQLVLLKDPPMRTLLFNFMLMILSLEVLTSLFVKKLSIHMQSEFKMSMTGE